MYQELPSDVLAIITNRLHIETCWALAQVNKSLHDNQVLQSKALQCLQANFYSCYLLKRIVEDKFQHDEYPVFKNKSWLAYAAFIHRNSTNKYRQYVNDGANSDFESKESETERNYDPRLLEKDPPPREYFEQPSNQEETENNIIFHIQNPQQDGTRIISNISLNLLIQKILQQQVTLNERNVLCTYSNSFPEIIEIIIHKYYNFPAFINATPEQTRAIQLRALSLLRHIIEAGYVLDASPLRKLYGFLQDISTAEPSASVIWRPLADELYQQIKPFVSTVNPITNTVEPVTTFKSVLDFSVEEIANNLTMLDFEIFSAIRPIELLHQAWHKPKLRHRCVNLSKLIDRSNQMSRWVSSIILQENTIKQRVKVFEKIIAICKALVELNNFHSANSFLSGLNEASVHRLKHTKEKLSKKAVQDLDNLMKLFESAHSFRNYRTAVTKATPPLVPYIGVDLTDLTFINEGSGSVTSIPRHATHSTYLVNLAFMRLETSVILRLQQWQQKPYTLPRKPELTQLLLQVQSIFDYEGGYQKSLQLEPRHSKCEDIL